MPNRMLRDWTGSDKVNSLTVQAERFFVRLIMKVDDYGCFYADTRLLKANLFPLLLDNIREADLIRWMAECQKADMIVLYENSGKKYIQIKDFKQRLDRARSKHPLPSTDNDSLEVVIEIPPEVEQNSKDKLNTKGNADKPQHTQIEIDSFKRFEEWLLQNAVTISKMKEPFKIDQFLKLKLSFTTQQIMDLCLKMHNWQPLLTKSKSAYLTFKNWSKKDFNIAETEKQTGKPGINELLKATKKQDAE